MKNYNQLTIALFYCLAGFLLPTVGSTQTSWSISGRSIPELKQDTLLQAPLSIRLNRVQLSTFVSPRRIMDHQPSLPISAPALPSFFSADDLAFFCKIEFKLEKATQIPVKFRLGEVEVIERMEGKIDW